jgi:hypothetical protein
MLHAGPVYIEYSFTFTEFHLRMRQISRPKLYNYQKGNNCASQLKELIIFIK